MKSNYLNKVTNCKFVLLLCLVLIVSITVNIHSQDAKYSFKVVISIMGSLSEDNLTAKNTFKVGEAKQIKVELTNLTNKRINIPKGYDYSRPTLFHNGKLVSYRKEFDDREKRRYRVLTGMLFSEPDKSQTEILDLNDFYGSLEPGRYQLSLERRFFSGRNIESNAIIFEVVPLQ